MSIRRFGISVGVVALLLAVAPRAFAANQITLSFSPASPMFVEGTGGTVDISTTNCDPATCDIEITSPTQLPAGYTFDNSGGDSATLTVDDTAKAGTTTITFSATDSTGDTKGTGTLTVVVRSLLTTSVTPSSATFTEGQPGQININATGFSGTPTITESGALPTGVTFRNNNNATASILGTPIKGTAGNYNLTITATHGTDPPASSFFRLTVLKATVSTSGASCGTLDSNRQPATAFHRGDRFFARGTMPGATSISLLWNGGSPTVGSDGVDSNGTYIVAATIPSNAALGANTVVARGNTGATATCSLNVVSAATPTSTSGTSGTSGTVTLPRTGMPMSALLALGLTMVEAGAGLILLTDRRRANPILLPHVRRFIGRR